MLKSINPFGSYYFVWTFQTNIRQYTFGQIDFANSAFFSNARFVIFYLLHGSNSSSSAVWKTQKWIVSLKFFKPRLLRICSTKAHIEERIEIDLAVFPSALFVRPLSTAHLVGISYQYGINFLSRNNIKWYIFFRFDKYISPDPISHPTPMPLPLDTVLTMA